MSIDLRLRTGLDVVVAEAGGETVERFGESVPPDILLALDRLGLSDVFRADGHCSCPGSVSFWGRNKPGYNDFILNPIGPAWHIDRPRFEAMLRARARETGASMWTATRAVAVDAADDGFIVTLRHRSQGTRRVRAAWVVDATGCAAWFARRQGARRCTHDRMVAIVRLADIGSGAFTAQTLVEATAQGWWYCARLPHDRIVTVLVTDRHAARGARLADYARWRELLGCTTLLAPRLDACRLGEERFRTYPVASATLDRVEGDRWLAIGDAASSLDPIAAQGIFKALADAADATEVIAAAASCSAPPWGYTERVAARFEDYLANRAYLYGLERRWAGAPFWRQRTMV
ncbi:NAD(P)/FAD-dependent oxidoreductase [Mycobacterium sp. Aquia_213]|uniref:NAD(P)/FAD-dependent oxidoreductase n=1 Tax=Mycobacterium sp. Aquia_213 TaxID=2991728 RepID=UPI00226DAAC7|nr:FAD-dependent monooxygenase [Mycobacterium sp. Aquia_213]WAC90205.1 FAD-dependent monooxygenase [Mycobacterium sp. Aquia_213]